MTFVSKPKRAVAIYHVQVFISQERKFENVTPSQNQIMEFARYPLNSRESKLIRKSIQIPTYTHPFRQYYSYDTKIIASQHPGNYSAVNLVKSKINLEDINI